MQTAIATDRPVPVATYSVLIRTRDSAATLPAVLNSVLEQELPPSRVIVVDSGSRDETVAIARAAGCTVLPYPTAIPFHYSRALNLGIEAAQDPFVLSLSSHSTLKYTDTTAVMLELLSSHSDAAACYAVHRSVAALPSHPVNSAGPVAFRRIGRIEYNGTNGLTNSASMIRKAHWREVRFDEAVPSCEDQFWACRQFERNRVTLRLESHPYCYGNARVNAWKLARMRYVVGRLCYPPFITWKGVARYAWKVARFQEHRLVHWRSIGLLLWFKISQPPVESFYSNYWDNGKRLRTRS